MRFVLLLLCAAASTLSAQSPVPADVTLHSTPGGSRIATILKGAPVRTGIARNGWTLVTIDGWVVSTRLSARRDSLDRSVTSAGTASLLAADGPRAKVLATLEAGMLGKKVQERNGWTRLRRAGWVRSVDLVAAPAPAKPAPAPAPVAEPKPDPRAPSRAETAPAQAAKPATRPANGDVVERTVRATSISSAPSGAERATLPAGAVVETLGRDRGWVRVRVEGWVPERDLAVADSLSSSRVSAADLRTSPERYRGALVRWEMQFIAVQRADALRKGMANNEPYLLLRGPGSETSIVYGALPSTLVAAARALPALTTVMVTGRVRDGRSDPVGVPVLDILSLAPVK